MEDLKVVAQEISNYQNSNKEIAENVVFWVSDLGIPKDTVLGKEWVCFNSYERFADGINTYLNLYQKLPEVIVLNCCLSDAQRVWLETAIPGSIPEFAKFRTKSGYHCLSLIMQIVDELNIAPPQKICIEDTEGGWILFTVLNKWAEMNNFTDSINVVKTNYTTTTFIELEQQVIKDEKEKEKEQINDEKDGRGNG